MRAERRTVLNVAALTVPPVNYACGRKCDSRQYGPARGRTSDGRISYGHRGSVTQRARTTTRTNPTGNAIRSTERSSPLINIDERYTERFARNNYDEHATSLKLNY